MVRLLLVVVPFAVLAGCKTENKAFCEDPNNMGQQGCPGDATNGGGCGSDGDCKMAGFPACEKSINQGTCEPCSATNKGVCGGTTPVCENNACVACVDDMQDCGGGVCLATGDCADTSRIIHASSKIVHVPNCGDSTTNPCSLNDALAMANASKNVIKLDDVGPFTQNGFTVSNDVTIDARGATLTRADSGPVLTVMGGKTLTLLGGTLQGAQGGNGSGILCNGATITITTPGSGADQTAITTNEQFGIDATNCTLTVTRAKIEKSGSTGIRASGGSITLARTWLDANNGGGLDINNGAQFTIVGNVIVNNGTSSGIIGGINIVTNASTNRLEFNSIAENKALATATAGIACAASFTAKNNIIWSNNSSVANMAGIQASGACGHSYSDIGPAPITGPIDMGNNQNIDPKFKDKASDLHLTSMSPLQMLQADPGSSVTDIAAKDIDGDPRAAPVYIGADQPPKP